MCIMCFMVDMLNIKELAKRSLLTQMLAKDMVRLDPANMRAQAQEMAETVPAEYRNMRLTADNFITRARYIAEQAGPIAVNKDTGDISFLDFFGPSDEQVWAQLADISPFTRKRLMQQAREGGIAGVSVNSLDPRRSDDMRREDTPATDEKAAQQAGATVTNIMDRIINSTKH